MQPVDREQDVTTPDESKTRPSTRFCNHRDMAGDSTVVALNGGAWCTSCGRLVDGE